MTGVGHEAAIEVEPFGIKMRARAFDQLFNARRIAPAAVIWPCVPNSRSAFIPTASRKVRQNRSERSSASSDNCRPSKAPYGPAGSNLSAVKPRPA